METTQSVVNAQNRAAAVLVARGSPYRPAYTTTGGVRAGAPSTTTASTVSASRTLPLSTEERLASLRAAREKSKEGTRTGAGAGAGVGSGGFGAGASVGTTASPLTQTTPQQTTGLELSATSGAAARLAARRLQAAHMVAEAEQQQQQQQSVVPSLVAALGGTSSDPSLLGTGATITMGARAIGAAGARTNAQARTPSISMAMAGTATAGGIPSGAGAGATLDAAQSGRTLPSRRGTGAETMQQPLVPVSRRPSMAVIEKEKKTDYWKDVECTATEQGAKLSGDDLNNVISRAMSLGIVGDKKQRESLSGPKSQELLEQLKSSMEQRLVELNGGKQINFDVGSNSNNIMEKVINLEHALSALESSKSQEEEEEKKRVQNKIGELERSLRALEAQKMQQREQNRKTMKLEIANLKEMMAKVQNNKENEEQTAQEAKALAAKMNRLEAALRLMNEERKKGTVEDKDTLLLRKKLALFDQKLKEMEAEKKMREQQDEGGALRDKLLLMEDKLAKMERRKSTSLTLQMHQKMEAVEKQLAMLRNERSGGHSDSTNAKIAQKMAMLEKQLHFMAQQKITPPMIQDEETVALRKHIKKLEESILQQEQRMEEQRRTIEEERKLNYEKRLQEEEAFRQQARQKEEELLKRIMQMEGRLKQGVVGGGGEASIHPALIERLKKLEEVGISPDLSKKFSKLEKQLEDTQKQLADERKVTAEFFSTVPKEGPELEDWQKDAQIALLMKANDDLMQRLNKMMTLIEEKMKQFSEMKFVGGGAPANKSGLSYAEINAKLAEIQAKLFDPSTDERESEQLNIEYEKLITELEKTPEYQKEQEDMRDKWRKENEIPNKEAFEKVLANLKAMPEQKLTAVFKRKPELKFILLTPDQLLKAHVNDFKQVSTQNLILIEARALYHNMPNFRKDQEQQIQFVQQLQTKIEAEAAKPTKPTKPAPPPIEAKKKVVIKTKKGGGGGGGNGFLDELLAKRKRKE